MIYIEEEKQRKKWKKKKKGKPDRRCIRKLSEPRYKEQWQILDPTIEINIQNPRN